jgi:hypothetical protein
MSRKFFPWMKFQTPRTVGPAAIFESKKELISQHILTVHAQYWIPNTQESWKFKIFVLHYRPE